MFCMSPKDHVLQRSNSICTHVETGSLLYCYQAKRSLALAVQNKDLLWRSNSMCVSNLGLFVLPLSEALFAFTVQMRSHMRGVQ